MKPKSLKNLYELEKHEFKNIPGFYGEKLIDGVVINDSENVQ